MSQNKNQDLNKIIRPYSFVLEEGKSIKHNYLDYSLKLLLGSPQFIANPGQHRKKKRSVKRR